jgi:putative endonuclease
MVSTTFAAMEEWYVYILECSDKTFYVGTTNNLDKRVEKHNSGKGAKYTRGRTPVKISYSEVFQSRSEACKQEYIWKKLSRQGKLDLIKPKQQ